MTLVRNLTAFTLLGLASTGIGCRNTGKPDNNAPVVASNVVQPENKGIVLNISDPVVKFSIGDKGEFKSIEYSNRNEILTSYGLSGENLNQLDAEVSGKYKRIVDISGAAVKDGKFSYIPLEDKRDKDPIENYNDDPERHGTAFTEMGFPVELKCTADTRLRVETNSFSLVRYQDKNTGDIKEGILYTYEVISEGKGFDIIPIRFPVLIYQGDKVLFVDPTKTTENIPDEKLKADDRFVTALSVGNLAKFT